MEADGLDDQGITPAGRGDSLGPVLPDSLARPPGDPPGVSARADDRAEATESQINADRIPSPNIDVAADAVHDAGPSSWESLARGLTRLGIGLREARSRIVTALERIEGPPTEEAVLRAALSGGPV